jgi:DNA-binding beta-propeller fold protein YncE
VPIGDTPEGVVIDDGHHLVVVALRRPDSLALVTLTSPRHLHTVRIPGRARHLRFAASGGPVLFPGEDSDHLYEVGLPSGDVVTDFVTGRQPHDAVLLYDLSGKPRMIDQVAVPGGPYGLAADPSSGQLWVAVSGRNLLLRFDVRAGRLVKRSISVRTVQQPNAVAISDSGTIAIAGAVRKGLLQIVTPIG